jgi:hypothetical protein
MAGQYCAIDHRKSHRKSRVQLTQSNAAIVGAFIDEVINKGDFQAAKLFRQTA